jgi:acetyl/propionyl-CoA carboxylase alpha subunit
MEGRRSALHGHAIEARIVAEDPARGFAPSTGRIVGWAPPTAPGVRVDSGFAEGVEVLPHYDSLLAKVIAHGETRPEAIERLRLALLDFHVLGVSTNIGWLIDVLSRVAFGEGRFDTGYVERELPDWRPPEPDLAALGAVIRSASGESRTGSGPAASLPRMWAASDGFRVAGSSSGTGRQSVDT